MSRPLQRNGSFAFVTSLRFAALALVLGLSAREASAKPKPKPAAPPASAAPSPAPAGSGEAAGADDADDDGPDVHFKDGPATIDLGHSLTLALPASDRFLNATDADAVLKKLGNLHNEGVLGLVAPKSEDPDWFAVIDWADEGHIKDDEAVDADQLLKDMKDAQKEDNEERVKQGFKALSIENFQVAPAYDKVQHHLSWALIVSDSDGKSVNFNTRILGRASFASVNLVTDPLKLETHKGEAMALLDATTFAKGQRYEDFDSKTDKVAEYGLAGLIAGGAGLAALKFVKIGLIAKFWNVILVGLLAAKKAVILAFAAVAAFFKRVFGKKKSDAPVTAAPAAPPGPPPPEAPPAG